jgi:malate dehydrogenase
MSPIKVVVTGAAGQIGYQMLFRLAQGEVFGSSQPIILHLLELEQAMGALEGVVMELQDCAFPLLQDIVYTSDLKTAFDGVNYAFLVGSVPRKAGMERSDLLAINAGVFIDQGRALNNYASKDVKTLVVGNPCNTNCLIASATASDIPKEQFFAMTMLDEKRARSQLAQKINGHHDDIECIIYGNHSSTLFPDYWNATYQGKPIVDLINDPAWLEGPFIENVQQRGAKIIQARGASSAASAANSALDTMRLIINGSDKPFSVAIYSNGEYGAPQGLFVSMPCTAQAGVVMPIDSVTHNALGKKRIETTVAELEAERNIVISRGLINA